MNNDMVVYAVAHLVTLVPDPHNRMNFLRLLCEGDANLERRVAVLLQDDHSRAGKNDFPS
jgi:hypothetical protein